jgi:hypothetical protein
MDVSEFEKERTAEWVSDIKIVYFFSPCNAGSPLLSFINRPAIMEISSVWLSSKSLIFDRLLTPPSACFELVRRISRGVVP